MSAVSSTPSVARALLLRGAGYWALWVVLIGTKPADLAAGSVVAALAAWASLRLLPPGSWRPRPLALLAFVPRFLWQSVVAGVDVARRAFDPRLPVRPGMIRYATRLPPGPARAAFTGITALLPGTVPCGEDADGALVYHVLDCGQDVAAALAAEEARLAPALGADRARAGND